MRMKASKWLAITWLVIMGTLTASALMHILIWSLGLYDPVEDDLLPAERLPWYVAQIFATPLVFLATFRTALKYAKPDPPPAG